jgi:hypothetical protein
VKPLTIVSEGTAEEETNRETQQLWESVKYQKLEKTTKNKHYTFSTEACKYNKQIKSYFDTCTQITFRLSL